MANKPYRQTTEGQNRNERAGMDSFTAEIKKTAIKRNTPQMETLLAGGYPDIGSVEHAKELIAERKRDPQSIPWEVAQRALAFLAAYSTEPIAIDTDPGPVYES